MRFQWDWLSSVATVPYVPALGPVHPTALSAELFNAVADVAGTGRFLPYDKDRRWFATKNERMILDAIIHQPRRTVIPTLSVRERGVLRIHYYGPDAPDLDEAAAWSRQLTANKGVRAQGRLIWWERTPDRARTRVMLKTFTDRDRCESLCVMPLANCDVADTFAVFAEQLSENGFAFLYRRLSAGRNDGPIFVSVEDDRIVGAIGPLTTMFDAAGVRQQPPQYFAVHPDYRQRGHGRALWRAAMGWGARNGARYKVLEAAVGSPAERLYLSEGLATLGYTCRRDLP